MGGMGQVARAVGVGRIAYDGGPPSLALCAGGIRPGTEHLSKRIHECFPVRDVPGNGYNCRPVNHQAGNPPSVHGTGRADDFGNPLYLPDAPGVYVPYGTDGAIFDTAVGDAVCDFLIEYAVDLQIQYLVHNRRSWSPNRVPGWRPYSGSLSHVDHVHMEQNRIGAELAPEAIDAVFVRAGLLPDPTRSQETVQMIVADPFDTRPNPPDARFARLLGDARTVRGVNGAKVALSADASPGTGATEVRLPFVAGAIVPHPSLYFKGRFVAYERDGKRTAGLRFIGG